MVIMVTNSMVMVIKVIIVIMVINDHVHDG